MTDIFHNSDGDEASHNINLTLSVLKTLPQFSQVDTSEMYEEEPIADPPKTDDPIKSAANPSDNNSITHDSSAVRRTSENHTLSTNNCNNSHLDVMKVIDSVNGELDNINTSQDSAHSAAEHKLLSTSKSDCNIDFNLNNHNTGHNARTDAHGYILDNSDTLNLNPTVYNSDFEDSEDQSIINSTTRLASLTQELATRRGDVNGIKNRNANYLAVVDVVPPANNTNVLVNHVAAACNMHPVGFSLSSSAALNSNISHFNLNSASNNNKNANSFKDKATSKPDSYSNSGSLKSNNKNASIDAGKVYSGYIESAHLKNSHDSRSNDINGTKTELYNSDNYDDDTSSLNLSQYNRYKFTNKMPEKQADMFQNGGGKTFSFFESFSDSSKVVAAADTVENGSTAHKETGNNPIFNEQNDSSNSKVYSEDNLQSPYVDDNSNGKSHLESHELIQTTNSHSNSHEVDIDVINAVNGIAAVSLNHSDTQIHSGNSGNVSSSSAREIYNYNSSVNQKNIVNKATSPDINISSNDKTSKKDTSNVGGPEAIHEREYGNTGEKHCHHSNSGSQRHRSHHRHHHKCHSKRKDQNDYICTNNNCCTRRISSLINASSNFLSHTGDDDIKVNSSGSMSKKKSRHSKISNTSKNHTSSRSKGRRKDRDGTTNDDTDSSYNSMSDCSYNEDSFDGEAEDEDVDEYEGVSRPLYVPAVIRKTEEKINVKRYHLTQQQKKKNAFLSIQTNKQSLAGKPNGIHENNNNSYNSNSSYILSPPTSLSRPNSPLQRITVTTSASAGISSHGLGSNSFDAHNAVGSNVDSCSSIVSSLQNAITSSKSKQEGENKASNSVSNFYVLNSTVDKDSFEITSSKVDHPKHTNNSINSDILGYHGKKTDKNDSSEKRTSMNDETYQERKSSNTSKSDLTQSQQPQFFLGMTSPRSSNSSSIMLMRSNSTANWKSDDSVSICPSCKKEFGIFFRKHHCRKCGNIFCDSCSRYRIVLDSWGNFRTTNSKFEKNLGKNYSSKAENIEDSSVKEVRSCEKCYKLYKEFIMELNLVSLKNKQAGQIYAKSTDNKDNSKNPVAHRDSDNQNRTITRKSENKSKNKGKDEPEEDYDEENYEVYENNWSTF